MKLEGNKFNAFPGKLKSQSIPGGSGGGGGGTGLKTISPSVTRGDVIRNITRSPIPRQLDSNVINNERTGKPVSHFSSKLLRIYALLEV